MDTNDERPRAAASPTVRRLLALAGLVLVTSGCLEPDSTRSPQTSPADADSGGPTTPTDAETRSRDASDAADASSSEPLADFPMSGVFAGSAELELPDGSPATAELRATTSETVDRFRGVLEVDLDDDQRPGFESVVTGEFDDDRETVDLRLGERRCPDDDASELCRSSELHETAIFETRGRWNGSEFRFDATRLREGFEEPDIELEPIMESLRLDPTPGFGPGSELQAPTGGLRPVGVDTGEPDIDPIPQGTTEWRGTVSHARFLADEPNGPVDCELTLRNPAEAELRLEDLVCDGTSLSSDGNRMQTARLDPDTFLATPKHSRLQFATRRPDGTHVFVGRRQKHLLSGILVRDQGGEYARSDEPLDPSQFSPSEVAAAFHLKRTSR